MSIGSNMFRRLFNQQDVTANTGLPDGTFVNAGDYGGLNTLINARRNAAPGVLPGQAQQLPPQLQRQPVNYPMPAMQGPMSQLAYRMAGASNNGLQQRPGMRIPTPPKNYMGMTNPTDILRMAGGYGQF